MIKSLVISDNPIGVKDNKRLRAVFTYDDERTKTIKFGQYNSKGTFFDGATDEKRNAYIARHKVNENWNKIDTAGALSKIVLWDFKNVKEITRYIKDKFKISNIKIDFRKIKI